MRCEKNLPLETPNLPLKNHGKPSWADKKVGKHDKVFL